MNNILIIGAGRSSNALINYVLAEAKKHQWFVTVADADPDLAAKKVNGHPCGRGTWLDVMKRNDRREQIERADIVVSLLPAHLHIEVAHDCIQLKKHLITASYVSKEMYQLGDAARDRNLIFMGEMGLDPGIDHMSAMETIDSIKENKGRITAFRSYTGGLIAPESDNNPWHYKFTWNPRNVVNAGKGTAQFLENGKYRYIPYNRLFGEYKKINVLGMGEYEVYPNRDSLLYKDVYGLSNIPNIVRGTIRHRGYCEAWNALVKIGLTEDSYPILESDKLTYYNFLDAYIPTKNPGMTLKERLASFLNINIDSEVIHKIEWLGLLSKKRIKITNASPALILENLLLEKWALKKKDKDMIIMQHEFEYALKGRKIQKKSTLVLKGENSENTAMAKLVGIPLGIFVKLVMLKKIKKTGVNIPVAKEIYAPVLEELKDFGVVFDEVEHEM